MSGNWLGDKPHDAAGGVHERAVVDAPRNASHGRKHGTAVRQGRAARRDRRRAERVWRLTLADHIAHWRARHRLRPIRRWWPR